jgi:hypothetical protein
MTTKLTPQIRWLVGLENLLRKARRRLRECEREGGRAGDFYRPRYAELLGRIEGEIHAVEGKHLEEYLAYVGETFLPRIARKVEETKAEMVEHAGRLVDGKAALHELRGEYTDALERVRTVRAKLGLDPVQHTEVKFGLEPHAASVDRRTRDAHILVREYLKS